LPEKAICLARECHVKAERHFEDLANHEVAQVLGTARYTSPEQAQSQRVAVDHRSDIYSLGVTLYELLTLQPAFDGRTYEEIMRQIGQCEPRRPRRLSRSIPLDLETIILKAISKEPAARYASAQHLADELAARREAYKKMARTSVQYLWSPTRKQ
jgi:serine/threonine protein kinase